MAITPLRRSGARILVDQLDAQGVGHVFCVPGESFLAVLDALHDSAIALTVCRQEGGAAMMAEAQGKLSGRPGICFVTRGPGATNAAAGVHIAQQDSTPLILFVGQVARGMREREAFQELDYRAVFGSMAKWVVEIDDPGRIPELVSRAFLTAMSGRPGPVVVALPQDMLTEEVSVADALPCSVPQSYPGDTDMSTLQELLAQAIRPLMVLGGSRWSAGAVANVRAFAERFTLPVACSFRRQMLFDHEHACYAGDIGIGINPKLAERIRQADLLLLIGARFSEMPSQGYALLGIPTPVQTLVHAHADAGELGKLYRPELAIQATPDAFTTALARIPASTVFPWMNWTQAARRDYLEWSDPVPIRIPGQLQMGEVMQTLAATLPADTILCNGAGNFATWVHRFWRFRNYGTQLAPTSGSMGYGVPAAIGAKRLFPDRTVVAFAGDGDFMMHGQELATAVQYGLTIIVILVDNGMFGTIRMHQEREYPGRVIGSALRNPDFAALALAYGAYGERVETTAEFAPAFRRALDSGRPAVLHCLLDPEAITPTTTLSGLRAASLRRAQIQS
ncbi:MAG: thiamine pyrophosphate-binding protein [Betaproteobacteria bacterium]|nr:thiamine pyrophosphate-binding protein [Betaproteobacteria bacterium]